MSDYRAFYAHSRALVIGINSYSDPRFMPLGQAEADALAFAEAMAGPPYEFQITHLLGAAATKNAILQALFTLRSSEADDRIMVYFAGHGYTLSDRQGNETGFLACADTVPEQDFTALKLDEVIDLTRQTDAKHICFIFDACFSGQALGLTRAPSVSSDKLMERRAYQVLSAGAGDQTVSDFQSMTSTMIEALRSGVLESDGLTTVNELGLYLQQTITRESNQTQIPQFGHVRGSQGGDFVFHVDTRVRLPGDLEESLRSARSNTRLGAVVDLIALAEGHDEVGSVARERLLKIAQEDSDERVRSAAQSFFDEQDALAQEEIAHQRRERAQEARQIAPPKMSRPAIEPPPEQIAEIPPKPSPRPAATPAPKSASKAAQPGVPVWIWVIVGLIALGGAALLAMSGLGGLSALSGGGGKIVFSSKRDGNYEIYVMNADGSSLTRLTNNAASDGSPVWSPDGMKIIFLSERDEPNPDSCLPCNWEIYVMNTDGSNVTRLTDNKVADSDPVWSPDGTQIAFVSDLYDPTYDTCVFCEEIYVMNAEGSSLTRLTNNKVADSDPVWSSDGTQIKFVSGRDAPDSAVCSLCWDIYMMNADGSSVAPLTNIDAYIIDLVRSPNGTQIAFVSDRDEPNLETCGKACNYEIYVVNANGNNVTRLTNNTAYDGSPVWSPDGRQIAFVSDRDELNRDTCNDTHTCNLEIYVMNADGNSLTRLTNNTAYDYSPVWSPDGRHIVFVSKRDEPNPETCDTACNYEIYVMNADGSGLTRLTNNPASDRSPVWSPK
jgi:TolB protein